MRSFSFPFLLMALLLAAGAAPAQDCFDYADLPHVMGSVNVYGARDIVLDGDVAYMCCANYGFKVVDIADPEWPQLLAYVPTVDWTEDVAYGDGYAYLADRNAGVTIYDVSDPAAPAPVDTLATGDYVFGLDLVGTTLYVPDYTALHVVDVSDPANPTILGSTPLPGYTRDVVVAGDYAYAADGAEGLQIVDVSDPANPTIVGNLPLSDHAVDVKVAGGLAYLAVNQAGLAVVDVSDPAAPVLVGALDSLADLESVRRLDVAGSLAYLATESGLHVIDVSDPANPALACKVGLGVGAFEGSGTYGVAVRGDIAWMAADAGGLQVVDVSDPWETAATGLWETPGFGATDIAMGSGPNEGLAYVTYGGGGLAILDLSDPDDPGTVALMPTMDSAYCVTPWGDDKVLVTDNSYAFYVVDVSVPVYPQLLGGMSLTDSCNDIAVHGDHAYLSIQWSGVTVVDLSDPANPVEVGWDWSGWSPGDLVLEYPLLYVADWNMGLNILDVSDPTAPAQVGVCWGSGAPGGIVKTGDLVIMAETGKGVQVIDVSDPADPQWQLTYVLPSDVFDLALDGDLMYAACYTAGLQAVDVTDPLAPYLIGTAGGSSEALAVAVGQGRVYQAAHFAGLEIFLPHCSTDTAVDDGDAPVAPAITAVAPNPFNPRTEIRYAAPAGSVELDLFDLRGHRVRRLVTGVVGAGEHVAVWDGRTDAGETAAAGVYVARLAAAGRAAGTWKLTLVR